jgi:hypothetical protein
MALEIRYGRHVGKIELDDHQNIVVHVSHNTVANRIKKVLEEPVTEIKPFRHPGIPGGIRVQRKIATYDDIVKVLLKHEHEFGIWVHTSDRTVHDIPWFGSQGVTLLKWNNSDVFPWFVVEDKATGLQAFYHGGLQGRSSLYFHWFTRPITQSGLIDDWIDFGEEFHSVEEIPYF